jgi:hypothetical protein
MKRSTTTVTDVTNLADDEKNISFAIERERLDASRQVFP